MRKLRLWFGKLAGEVHLRDRGSRRIRPARNREQVVDAAIGQPRHRVGDLPDFADRPVEAQDAGQVHRVGGPVQVGEVAGDLGVDQWAGPADGGIGVTLGAAVGVEARPQARPQLAGNRPGNGVNFLKSILAAA